MRKTYRGKLPDADKRGYVRPEIGGHRFTVGNVRTDSQGEMKRRRDAVADLFELQCRQTGEDRLVEPFLGFAKKLASGQRLKLSVSDYARANVGQASEEAQALAAFREMGLDIVADDPLTIAKGEAELKSLIDEKVRSEIAKALANVGSRFQSYPQGLVGSLQTKLPTDPENLETRTFFEAIDAYRKHLLKTGKRQDNGKPSPSVQNYLDTARRLKKSMDDRPMWEIDRTKLDEMFAYWRNRPVSSKTGKPIASDTAKHLMDTLWSILTWIDEEDGWKWSLPNGAKRIRRSPEQIDSDRKKLKSRRITANTYSPEQLAIIASKLDRFGKMILGISVNCAMQPAEVDLVNELNTAGLNLVKRDYLGPPNAKRAKRILVGYGAEGARVHDEEVFVTLENNRLRPRYKTSLGALPFKLVGLIDSTTEDGVNFHARPEADDTETLAGMSGGVVIDLFTNKAIRDYAFVGVQSTQHTINKRGREFVTKVKFTSAEIVLEMADEFAAEVLETLRQNQPE